MGHKILEDHGQLLLLLHDETDSEAEQAGQVADRSQLSKFLPIECSGHVLVPMLQGVVGGLNQEHP